MSALDDILKVRMVKLYAFEPQRTDKIVLCGGPKSGKTTLSDSFGYPVLHTDDAIIPDNWSACSETVSHWLEESGPWVIEGVAGPRALRKWLTQGAKGAPLSIIYLHQFLRELSGGQDSMRKGCATVWREIKPALVALKCPILEIE